MSNFNYYGSAIGDKKKYSTLINVINKTGIELLL